MTGDAPATVAGEQLTLLPERAAYWPRRRTLFVADVHIDKAETLRTAHVAAPLDVIHGDLDRLAAAAERTGAVRLVVLGDLYHGRGGAAHPVTVEALAAWRRRLLHVQVLLVEGNHDRRAGAPPDDLGIITLREGHREPPFVYRHRPAPDPGGYVLAGHVHAGVRLGAGADRLVLPAFRFGRRVGVFPAFGSLTGAQAMPPGGDDVYPIADGAVHAL